MASTALIAQYLTPELDFWDRFCSLAQYRVSEGNMVAGEHLWQMVPPLDSTPRFTIRSTRYDANSLECHLDWESSLLTCKPGSAIDGDPLSFQLLEGAGDKLQRNGVECTLDQAVSSILDALVWIEEGNSSCSRQ